VRESYPPAPPPHSQSHLTGVVGECCGDIGWALGAGEWGRGGGVGGYEGRNRNDDECGCRWCWAKGGWWNGNGKEVGVGVRLEVRLPLIRSSGVGYGTAAGSPRYAAL